MVEPVSIEPLGEQRPPPVGPPAEVPVRPAATVMLVKDTPAGLEVFVLRRVVGMAFAGGMTAFPGGAVDGSDHETDHAAPLQWWAGQLGVTPDTARALVVAAARELFEETGVLLARPSAGVTEAGSDGPDQIAAGSVTDADRIAVLDRRVPFADVLTGADLELRADLLRPWANWVTPAGHTRRYDTFFFAAALPASQRARLLTSEADLGQWRAPQALLAEYDVGAVQLMPPTLAMLTDLAGAGSVAEVMAARRVVTPVRFGEPSGGGTVGTVGTSVSVVQIAAAPDVTMRKGLS